MVVPAESVAVVQEEQFEGAPACEGDCLFEVVKLVVLHWFEVVHDEEKLQLQFGVADGLQAEEDVADGLLALLEIGLVGLEESAKQRQDFLPLLGIVIDVILVVVVDVGDEEVEEEEAEVGQIVQHVACHLLSAYRLYHSPRTFKARVLQNDPLQLNHNLTQ